jgi:bifunctional DNA-binding transcriptional regulator/antitoxin component of YhaV-PrlF toxin-antitoxin module
LTNYEIKKNKEYDKKRKYHRDYYYKSKETNAAKENENIIGIVKKVTSEGKITISKKIRDLLKYENKIITVSICDNQIIVKANESNESLSGILVKNNKDGRILIPKPIR